MRICKSCEHCRGLTSQKEFRQYRTRQKGKLIHLVPAGGTRSLCGYPATHWVLHVEAENPEVGYEQVACKHCHRAYYAGQYPNSLQYRRSKEILGERCALCGTRLGSEPGYVIRVHPEQALFSWQVYEEGRL